MFRDIFADLGTFRCFLQGADQGSFARSAAHRFEGSFTRQTQDHPTPAGIAGLIIATGAVL